MKVYLIVLSTMIVFVGVGAWLLARDRDTCADAKPTSMGQMIAPGSVGYTLSWNSECKSGMKWVKR